MLTKSTNWRDEAAEIFDRVGRETKEREAANLIKLRREIEEGAARLLAMSDDERLSAMFRADIRRAERLAALPPHKFEDKLRQHQGEFTNESANYDEAREEQGHR